MFIFDDRTQVFLEVNKAALRLYGYSRKAFLAMTAADICVPAEAPAGRSHCRQPGHSTKTPRRGRRSHGADGPIAAGVWRHMKRDGTVFDADITVSDIEYAGRPARMVVVRDITAAKRSERERVEAGQRLAALMHALPIGVSFADDTACRRVTGNPALLAQFEVTPADNVSASASDPKAAGRRVRYFNGGRELADEDLPLQRAAAENAVISPMELDIRLPGGRCWTAEASGAPLHDAMGNTTGAIAVTVDITARKQTERDLKHRLAIEQLLASASSRLANVAVADLDTTLTEVLGDIGRITNTDRCFLFRVSDDLAVADNTHEWCAQGIRSQIADLRNIPTAGFRWMMRRLRGGDPLCIPRVSDIPASALAERHVMEEGCVLSAIFVPIRHAGRLSGFIGCDTVRGERLWSDDDIRLLRILGEALTHALIRCRTDEALRNMAREWQSTFDGVADAIWLLDVDQRILRSNKAAAALFGKSVDEMLGRHCWEIVHGTRQPIPECPVVRMKRSRHRESMELPVNGRWYLVVVDPLFAPDGALAGAVHIVSDITERKRTEGALRNLTADLERRVEERTAALKESMVRMETLQAIISRGPVVLFLWRALPNAWPVEMVSDNVAAVLGYTADDFMSGRVSWPGITFAEDRPRLEAEVARFLEQGASEWSQEYRVTTRRGEMRWIHDWNRTIKDAKGTVTHIQALLVDITARKQAELSLARSHRALRVLTDGNRALVRARTEGELLNEACRVVVEVGGYSMAWIGFAEHDAGQSIRPIALVGSARDLLSRMTMTWANTGFGQGPTGTAIRTRKPRTCHDTSKDLRFAPWRKEALKRGYASVLALPLMAGMKCLGALTICAAQRDAFDDAEVQLLQQLANDIAFGIMAFRERVKRRELERQVLDIAEREQRRLGQDLHDGVGQSLTGINYLLSVLQQDLAGNHAPESVELERIRGLVEETIHQTRDLARGLFPGELTRGGLVDALHELAVSTRDIFGIPCRFTGLTAGKLADANVISQVYRIAQEAVNNSAKHSKAGKIQIGLSQKCGRVVLTVRDTGIGILKTTGKSAGMGLRIMKYRADLIGAELSIESVRGKGTTVRCTLPPE
jgi:PAS domain S-box-containing protein